MKYIILFIKGLLIGIAKTMPGISGSVLAVTLNVYEKAIYSISHLFNKKNLKFLFILGISISLSIIFFSNIINYLLDNYHFITMYFLVGLLFGTIPGLLRKTKITKKSDFLIILSPFIIMYIITKISSFEIKISFVLLGVIESITTIIPGISGTAIYMMLGCYNTVLNLFSNPLSLNFLIFIIGFILTTIIISILINYLFQKYHNKIYLFVVSLSIYSFVYLLKNLIIQKLNLIYIFIFIISTTISYFLNKINIKE